MRNSVVTAAAVLAVMCVAGGALAQTVPAGAWQEAQARMPEPEPEMEMRMPVPGGGGNSQLRVRGCWRANQILFGKYRVAFCLDRGVDGSYRVDGGGLTCRGDLDWSRNGRQVEIRFNRGRCNRNTDWSRDRISCRIEDGWGGAPGALAVEPAQARMPTPGGGGEAWRMSCIYRPSTGPFGPQRFTARRTD
jgi:hypothetical protein